MPNTTSNVRGPKLWLTVAALAIAVGGGYWWLSRPPIRLSENDYAVTSALYRVCNQESETGLDQIENLLKSAEQPTGQLDDSQVAIRAIIADARGQRWKKAAINCRRLLDEQVQR